ncbi:fungal-specific transcription factor domain-containing protein [Melampsora americana]|nr:fungal-specific transcription factor domain-containing protein [Melampsora americana]
MASNNTFVEHRWPTPSTSNSNNNEALKNTNFNLNVNPHSKGETSARISLACLTSYLRFIALLCSSRKVRCNGKSPCASCVSSNRECTFDQAKTKRKRKTRTVEHQNLKTDHPPSASLQSQALSPDSRRNCFPPLHSSPLNPTSAATRHDHNQSNDRSPLTPHQSTMDTHLNFTNSPHRSPENDISSHSSPPTRIPYFRFLGPTAIAPGAPFREISMKLVSQQANGNISGFDQKVNLNVSPISSNAKGHLSHSMSLSDPITISQQDFCKHVEVFYDHMGSFISCIDKEDLLVSLFQGKISEALKLAISALAECIQPSSTILDYTELWSQRAKSLVIPHLSLPSLDTTYTLLLLAYLEFSRDKDSGLWMWSGLAFRMAIDLGLYKSTKGGLLTSYDRKTVTWDQSELRMRERIFWSCYHLDRLISSGTGRVASFLDSEIEIDLPPVIPIPLEASKIISDEPLLAPFHYLTRILILLGKISDAFNRSKSKDSSTREKHAEVLQTFRAELHEFHGSLPHILHFTGDNARRYIEAKHGQAFLLIHLWFHTLVIITHTATVGPAWSALDVGPVDPMMLEWSRGSVRTISDMLAFGNLFDPDIFLSVPFASQPIMIAACASIPNKSLHNSTGSLETNYASVTPSDLRNFDICATALRNMQPRWRGVSWLVSTLNSRASYETDVDLSTTGGAEVSTCDNSLMNKLVEKSGEVLRLSRIRHEALVPHFVGLTASGTFHEPATGRLSLLHQASPFSTTSIECPDLPQPIFSNTPSGCSSLTINNTSNSSGCANSPMKSHSSPSVSVLDYQKAVGTPFDLTSMPIDPDSLTTLTSPNSSQLIHPINQNISQDYESVQTSQIPLDHHQIRSNLRFELIEGNHQPTLTKEFLEELFSGEVGVWSSFKKR